MDNNVNTGGEITQAPSKKSTGTTIAMIICALLAVFGIAFGVYEFLNNNKKTEQISNLETELETKNSTITELESKISNLESETIEPEATTTENSETATIVLGEPLEDNETRTVFRIGDCTIDPPSTKCPVVVNDKESLISVVTTDGILRLTIPKE